MKNVEKVKKCVFNKITCCLTKRTLYKSNIEPAFDSIAHLSLKPN